MGTKRGQRGLDGIFQGNRNDLGEVGLLELGSDLE
jgi:hypothetical protein